MLDRTLHTVISKHILEIQFKPDAGFLDKRGRIAEHLSSPQTLFDHWNITANRIDFTSDDNGSIRAFVSFRNLGVVSTPPNNTEFFIETAKTFLTVARDRLLDKEFSRIGVRSRFLVEAQDFGRVLKSYRERFLGLEDEEVEAFQGDLVDVGFPLNFVDGGNHFNVITGPMDGAQSKQMLGDYDLLPPIILKETSLFRTGDVGMTSIPAVGVFVDVDFFRDNSKGMLKTNNAMSLLDAGVKRAEEATALIVGWILEGD